MGDDGPSRPAKPRGDRPRRKILPLAVLLAGGLVAIYLAGQAPREQHVRFVLGASAADVTSLTVQYVAPDGETAREARLGFEPGRAPRVVPHEPSLPDGPYRLRIEADTHDGRRSTERQVTLGGGTTSVDISAVLQRARDE